MNDLNSVLFEGTVSGDIAVADGLGALYCCFTVVNLRCFKDLGIVKEQETRVLVRVSNTKMAKTAVKRACDGRKVRVVGWLAEVGRHLYIEADHIEYRPGLKDGGK